MIGYFNIMLILNLCPLPTPKRGDSLSNRCDGIRGELSRISSGRVTVAFYNLLLLSLAASSIGRLLGLPNLLRLLPRFILHFTGISLCWHYIVNVIFCRGLIWTKDKFLATVQNRRVVFSHCQNACRICRLTIYLAFY